MTHFTWMRIEASLVSLDMLERFMELELQEDIGR